MIQTDLRVGGRTRHVLLQASKNGFFYVLDRKTGELISGKPFTYINWATGLDRKGRPILTPVANYTRKPQLIYPSTSGGHAWIPMSLSPQTHLVYIPVMDAPMLMDRPRAQAGAATSRAPSALGALYPDDSYDPAALKDLFGPLPHYDSDAPAPGDPRRAARLGSGAAEGVWEQETSRDYFVYDGGVMSTGGNLVFQGRADGSLYVYAADSGKLLHKIDTGSASWPRR